MNETENNGRVDDEDRAYRGGGLHNHSFYCRATNRYGDPPGYRSVVLGFRLAIPMTLNSERK